MKKYLDIILNFVLKGRIIIISLVVLVLFGYSLLQIQKATGPTASPVKLEEGKAELDKNRVRFDEETIEAISKRELDSLFSPLNASNQRNPFVK